MSVLSTQMSIKMSNGRRTSDRWSLNGRPNFKEISGGKKIVFSERNNEETGMSRKPTEKLLWEGLTCNLYEEIMQYMRTYEKAFDCKLNASMVTLKLRQGRPDYLYYRSITFWCSYCIQGGKPFMSPSLGLTQRFCPFLVVVNGDPTNEALVVTQIYPNHQHLPHVSSEVASDKANPRPFGAPSVAPNPAHVVSVPIEINELPEKEHVRKSISPPKGVKRQSIAQPAKSVSSKRQSSSSGSGAEAPKRSASTSHVINKSSQSGKTNNGPASHVAKASHHDKSDVVDPDEEEEDLLPNDVKCQLCKFKTRSKNAFTGHVWLVHKLLTDFIIF